MANGTIKVKKYSSFPLYAGFSSITQNQYVKDDKVVTFTFAGLASASAAGSWLPILHVPDEIMPQEEVQIVCNVADSVYTAAIFHRENTTTHEMEGVITIKPKWAKGNKIALSGSYVLDV